MDLYESPECNDEIFCDDCGGLVPRADHNWLAEITESPRCRECVWQRFEAEDRSATTIRRIIRDARDRAAAAEAAELLAALTPPRVPADLRPTCRARPA